MQQITGLLITTFLLGTFYRSASLYHPQRRAILHLKTQKRKIKNKDKEKNKLQVRLKNYVPMYVLGLAMVVSQKSAVHQSRDC